MTGDESVMVFKGWGTCFNELGWDALQVLPEEKRGYKKKTTGTKPDSKSRSAKKAAK